MVILCHRYDSQLLILTQTSILNKYERYYGPGRRPLAYLYSTIGLLR